MKLFLHCSPNIQKVLAEMLSARGIAVGSEAAFSLVERGFPPPDKGIAALFDPANLDGLLQFLDGLKHGTASRSESDTVVGKKKDTYDN